MGAIDAAENAWHPVGQQAVAKSFRTTNEFQEIRIWYRHGVTAENVLKNLRERGPSPEYTANAVAALHHLKISWNQFAKFEIFDRHLV